MGDVCDSCPHVGNTDQADVDLDGVGDACDPCIDPDADGFGSDGLARVCPLDNCPDDSNASQSDSDGDGAGDVCDPCPLDALDDEDGDGACGNVDNCPWTPNDAQTDTDGDGIGDACDSCPNAPDLVGDESETIAVFGIGK